VIRELASLKSILNKKFNKTGKCYVCHKRGHDAKECKMAMFNQINKLWNKINNINEKISYIPMITNNRLNGKFKKIDEQIGMLEKNNRNSLEQLEILNNKIMDDIDLEMKSVITNESNLSISTNFFTIAGEPSEIVKEDNEILVVDSEDEYKKMKQKFLKEWEELAKNKNDEGLVKFHKKIQKFELYNRDIIDPISEYERDLNILIEKLKEGKLKILTRDPDQDEVNKNSRAQQPIKLDQKTSIGRNLVDLTTEEKDENKLGRKYEEKMFQISTKSGVDGNNSKKTKKKRKKINLYDDKESIEKIKEQNVKKNLETIKNMYGEQLYSKVKRNYELKIMKEEMEILERKYDNDYEVMNALVENMQRKKQQNQK
jgi:hypothetical protein